MIISVYALLVYITTVCLKRMPIFANTCSGSSIVWFVGKSGPLIIQVLPKLGMTHANHNPFYVYWLHNNFTEQSSEYVYRVLMVDSYLSYWTYIYPTYSIQGVLILPLFRHRVLCRSFFISYFFFWYDFLYININNDCRIVDS